MDRNKVECLIISCYLKRRNEDSKKAEPSTNKVKMSLDILAFLQQHFWRNGNPGRCQALKYTFAVNLGHFAELLCRAPPEEDLWRTSFSQGKDPVCYEIQEHHSCEFEGSVYPCKVRTLGPMD